MLNRLIKLLLLVVLLTLSMGTQYIIPFNPRAAAGGLSCICPTSANGIDFNGVATTGQYAFMLIEDNPAAVRFPDDVDWTLGMWVDFDVVDTWDVLISQYGAGGGDFDEQVQIQRIGANNQMRLRWNNSTIITHGSALSSGTWYFIVISHDDSEGSESTMWIYNAACSEIGSTATGAEGSDSSGTAEDVGAGASRLTANPPVDPLNGQMAYMFYAEGSGSVWTSTEVEAACASGSGWCSEMTDLEAADVLSWAYPLDGKNGDDCSTNEQDATFTEVGDEDIDANAGNGPYG